MLGKPYHMVCPANFFILNEKSLECKNKANNYYFSTYLR